MKRFVFISILAVLATALIVFIRNESSVKQGDKTGREYAFQNPRYLSQYLFEQKKERKGKPKYDRPNKAMEYEVLLRSEINKPYSYSGNWKLQAYQQAKSLLSLQKRTGEMNWIERGPANIGGRSRAIAVHPDFENVWWVGAVGGGVWHTENAGLEWTCQSDNLPVISITTIDICRSFPEILYAGTGEGFYNYDAVIGDGIFKTTNGGLNWEQLTATAGNSKFRFVNRIVVHPQHPDTLLAATNAGLYRSLNGGLAWVEVFTNGSRVQQIVANPENFNTLFITVNGKGIYRSVDLGVHWTRVSEEISDHERIEMAISPADTNYLYASVANSSSGLKGFYQSKDGGKAWGLRGSDPNWLGGQGWYDNTVVADPYNPSVAIVGGVDLYKVTVNGSSMQASPISHWYGANGLPYVHADQHFLVTLPRSNGNYGVVAANDGGIFYSSDKGLNWESRNSNYNVTQYYDADRSPFADQFIAGSQDNGTNLSPSGSVGDSHWKEVIGGDGFDCVWDRYDPMIVYGTLYSSLIYKSTDSGENFHQINSGLPESDIFHTPLTMDPANSKKLFTISGADKIYYSDDGGESWESASASLGSSSWVKIAVCVSDPSTVWAASTSSYINLSTDGGKTYALLAKPSETPDAHLTGFATYPDDNAAAIITFGVSGYGKIFRSRDLGSSWENITANLPNVPVHCAVVMPFDTQQIWIGTDIGLFISYNDGQSWQYESGILPAVSIRRLKIVNQEVVAATHGRGVWSIHDNRLPLLEAPMRAPVLADLTPPNPNNNTLKINFMARSNYDSLSVRVNEKHLATLFNAPIYTDTFAYYISTPPELLRVIITGYKDNVAYPSDEKIISTFTAIDTLQQDFEGESTFYGDLTVELKEGFSNKALHTPHPYDNKRNYIAWLGSPLRISEDSRLTWRDVALVEPGEEGYEYPDYRMWDYVTVEGSVDGENWDILIKPYDCRYHSDWRFYYNSNLNGEEYMYLDHTIDLDSAYTPGQNVAIRFRLFADEYSTGWGWVIDDLHITSSATGLEPKEITATKFELIGNYPNPFNPATTIRFTLAENAPVSLFIYDNLGRLVKTIYKEQPMSAGNLHQARWDAANDAGRRVASGAYYYRLIAGDKQAVKKMLLLR
jgi:photosystem II stability/assembly factor-like uncharacterized protein